MKLTMIKQQQSGAALFVALIMLLTLTLLGVSAMRTTGLQERMARNLRDRSISIQSNEALLRTAENWIRGLNSVDATPSVQPSCTAGTACAAVWPLDKYAALGTIANMRASDYAADAFWKSPNVQSAIIDSSTNQQGNYFAEFFIDPKTHDGDQTEGGNPAANRIFRYRITANGRSGPDGAESIVQTTFNN
jgi:type IV pilus assembly protein PilX